MITGHSSIIAHLGVPTEIFKSPLIYNPWFDYAGIDCHVVPLGCEPQDFLAFVPPLLRQRNVIGCLITMPHKTAIVDLLDHSSAAVNVCGACNAVRLDQDGAVIGDMFDGEGFVRGMRRKGFDPNGLSAFIVGAGGVGSAIAAALAASGVSRIALYDVRPRTAESLKVRLESAFPKIEILTGTLSAAGYDIAVNATPLGLHESDPLPFDLNSLARKTFVGDVVMGKAPTSLIAAAKSLGCPTLTGTEMLFEQIPAYLDFFGFDAPDVETLRRVSKVTQ